MKFFAAVLALAAVALALPATEGDAPVVKRQNIVTDFDISSPAMSDASGNVVPFDAANVYKDASAKGI